MASIKVGEAKRLYRLGWTLTRLADRYGVSHQAVNESLRRAGCKIRPPMRGSVSRHDWARKKILALVEKGIPAAVAGRKFGIPRSCAQRFVLASCTHKRRCKPRPRKRKFQS